MQTLRLAPAFVLLFLGGPAAFGDAIHWQRHLNLRISGQDGSLGLPDPGEIVTTKISREIDYISMNIESAFFRNMPGFTKKHQVVVGVEVEGLLPDGKTLKTVGEVSRCRQSDCFVTFDEIPILQPALYPGRNVTFTLTMRAAGKDEAIGYKGRIQGVSGLLKKLAPGAETALSMAAGLFDQIIEGSAGKPITWKYRFSRYPADAVIGEEPAVLFTSGRHVILALPPKDSPKEIRNLKPTDLISKLKWVGRRLVWKASGDDFLATPYVILAVTRYKRYPNPDTPLQRLKVKLLKALDQGNTEQAGIHLRALGPAIVEDQVITNAERQLERTWIDDYKARIDTELAKQAKDPKAERDGMQRQALALLDIREQFGHILEAAEKQDLAFRLRKLGRDIGLLDEKLGDGGSAVLRKRLEEDAAQEGRAQTALDMERERARRAFGGKAKVELDKDGFVAAKSSVATQPGESPERVRARALDEARRSAVATILGGVGSLAGSFFGASAAAMASAGGLASSRVKENLPDLMGDALVVDEKIVREGPAQGGGYEVELKAKVVRRGVRTDPGYRVKLALSKTELVEGDEAVVSATPTRDSHLYMFSVGADGEVTVLVPNKFAAVPFVKAGETYTFPSPEIRARRIKIQAQLPKGARESVESVKVIALRKPLELVSLDPKAAFHSVDGKSTLLIGSILGKLAVLNPDDWCNDTVSYTIRAR